MPLYEYKCGCGHVTELLRKYTERDDRAICEDCEGLDTERLTSATKRQNFRFNRDPRTKVANLDEV